MSTMFSFFVAKLHADAVWPKRAKPGDAGMDLTSVETKVVPPRGRALIDTGIAISLPNDCYGRVAPRSGLAVRHGIDVLAGVVDSSYRGSIQVVLFNNTDENFAVNTGDRIAQLIIERIYSVDLIQVPYDELTNTERGAGGFGSTGISRTMSVRP
jgi:dUTP pyrophosphatase